MHAVLIEVDTSGQPDKEAGLTYLREEVVPRVSAMPGFKAGYWLRPGEDEQGFSLVLFDTEKSAKAASEGFGVGGNPAPGVTVVRHEVHEIAASA
jgi:heme-degrading monooxygenase HmoA